MQTTTATLIAAGVGLAGAFAGTLAAQYLTRSSQRIQWVLDNRKQECREVLSALSVCYHALLRVKNNRRFIDYPSKEILVADWDDEQHYKSTEGDLKLIIGDRLFIASDVEAIHLRERWISAATKFGNDWEESSVMCEFETLRTAIVRMATDRQETWWQKYLRELKDDELFK